VGVQSAEVCSKGLGLEMDPRLTAFLELGGFEKMDLDQVSCARAMVTMVLIARAVDVSASNLNGEFQILPHCCMNLLTL
jgi:hypothetical protein